MVNNYAAHLGYARQSPGYSVAFSETPTAIAMGEIAPETLSELRAAVRDGRATLANIFYLETSPDLMQGETLLRLGLESMRWQDATFGQHAETAWFIDTLGVHRQIPEILAQLGVRQIVYGRNPPMDVNVHLWRSPSGREALAVYSDFYQHWRPMFAPGAPKSPRALSAAREELARYRSASAEGMPSLFLVGASDYSPAPREPGALDAAIDAVREGDRVSACMSTPAAFFEAVRTVVGHGARLPSYEGENLTSYNLFWMSNPRVKQEYRRAESRLLRLEAAAAMRSLEDGFEYPSRALQQAWTLLFLNSDRALLWGIGAGAPFYGPDGWSVADRFARLDAILDNVERALGAPPAEGAPPTRTAISPPRFVQAGEIRIEFDPATGDLVGIEGARGHNMLGGASNVIALERQPPHDLHQDYLSPPDRRIALAGRDRGSSRVRAWSANDGRTIVESTETMHGGAVRVSRSVTIARATPRISVELSLFGVPEDAIAFVRFKLATPIAREWRGLPYGYAMRDPRERVPVNPQFLMHDHRTIGLHDTVAPAVRWSAHTDAGGAGIAIFDIGTPGREVWRDEARLMLMAASTHYRGLPNAWLDGAGETRFSYVLEPVFSVDPSALARHGQAVSGAPASIGASANFMVESVRREGRWLEVRGVETSGNAGIATIAAPWRHRRALRTNAFGEGAQELRAQNGGYAFSVRPQEIVTLRFDVGRSVPSTRPLETYAGLYPASAAADMALRDHNLIGHPPER